MQPNDFLTGDDISIPYIKSILIVDIYNPGDALRNNAYMIGLDVGVANSSRLKIPCSEMCNHDNHNRS